MSAPNFIVFLTDDQGYGDLSCMGATDFRTPHLDRLAADGVSFSRAYAGVPSCIAARASLHTGLRQATHGRVGYQDRVPWSYETTLAGLLAGGAALTLAGWLWGFSFPLNKALWTSSYVLYTGGLALWLLALAYWLIEMKGIKAWGKPFEIFGINAIAAYMLPIFLLKFLVLYKLPVPGGEPLQLRLFLCDHVFGTWLSPLNASAAFAFSYMGLWLGFFWLLYRKNVFIKI